MAEPDPVLESVAIIGMSGRFPDAANVDEFWANLRSGRESVRFFDDDDLRESGVDEALLRDPNYVKAGGILDGIDLFDAEFFGFSPREAERTDPQKRLFLECAWEALESAACDPSTFTGRIGVFAGTSGSSYHTFRGGNPVDAPDVEIANGTDFLATRVSYKLNLRGPSFTVQCACSTSLVAVSLAYQALMNYQCDVALAGGVSIYVPQRIGYFYREGGFMSRSGRCRSFDASGDGIVRGTGVGVVVLKRNADAIQDRDPVDAIVRGIAINNDGATKVGYAAPSVEAQAEVIAEALELADVSPETIGYVETHGAGTPLGDPIEVAALTKAFRAWTDRKQFCAIGSVKANIGHTDTAAGVAGLIKTVQILKHREIPPNPHFEQPNSQIDFEGSPFFINKELLPWSAGSSPRRAGVSSFGLGGTNVHVVLEEAPERAASAFAPGRAGSAPAPERAASTAAPEHAAPIRVPERRVSTSAQLLVLSAKTPQALDTVAVNLAAHLRDSRIELGDVAYTLQLGRRAFAHRKAIVCRDHEEAIHALENRDGPRTIHASAPARRRGVAFLFPGQGAQYPDMTGELYREIPQFRDAVDSCCRLLMPHLGIDLAEVMFPGAADLGASQERLTQTRYAQPAVFTIEYALATLLMHWGIRPVAMLGHSFGEFAAACLSGVMSLSDALALVAARGRLVQELPEGAMLAVSLSVERVQRFLDGDVSLAAHNAPELCVLSGGKESIARLEQRFDELEIRHRRIHTSHAFHSPMMEPAMAGFAAEVRKVSFSAPMIPCLSNMTGDWLGEGLATDPDYWVRQLREPVRFNDAIASLSRMQDIVLLEVGPGRTLTSLTQLQPRSTSTPSVFSSVRHPKEERSDVEMLLETVGKLWLEGVTVDWMRLHEGTNRQRLRLPTYPFQRRSYWLPDTPTGRSSMGADRTRAKLEEWFYLPFWQPSVTPQKHGLQGSRWMVLADADGHCGPIVRRLEQRAASVVTVTPGSQWSHPGRGQFVVRPGEAGDAHSLMIALRESSWTPTHILHAWTCTPEDVPPWELESVEASERALGFSTLLTLAHTLSPNRVGHPVMMSVLTTGTCSVIPGERVSPGKATMLGMCRVIPQEYPRFGCRCIDVSPADIAVFDDDGFADQILNEASLDGEDVMVAYRSGHRWVPGFSRVRLEASDGMPSILRPHGVYLITGGLGGIGLEVADYLARSCKGRLVLTSRSTFPEESEWTRWIATHGEANATSRTIERLRRLQAEGAQVMVANVDVCDREGMHALLEGIVHRWGAIHGVFHAAGVASVETIGSTSFDVSRKVFEPKVRGTQVLAETLAGRDLDFILLFSSLASLLGGAWLAAYASANAYLNAVQAAGSSMCKCPWMVIIWDGWSSKTGMGQKIDHPLGADAVEEASARSIQPEEGIEALHRILHHRLPRVITSTWDLGSRYQIANLRPEPSPDVREPELESAQGFVSPQTDSEQLLARIWMDVLGVTEFTANDNFFDLGGNSLMVVEVINKLKQTVDRPVGPDDLMFSTFGQLAKKLETVTRVEDTDVEGRQS